MRTIKTHAKKKLLTIIATQRWRYVTGCASPTSDKTKKLEQTAEKTDKHPWMIGHM